MIQTDFPRQDTGRKHRAVGERCDGEDEAILRDLRIRCDAAGTAVRVVDAALPSVRFRALTRGPDGNLYVATDAGEIWRVTPSVWRRLEPAV